MLLELLSGATLVTKSGTGFDFKEGTVVKASITSGGFIKPASVATSALPTTCADGSLVWDSTVPAVKYCVANVWTMFGSTPGATPPTCSAGSAAVSYNGSSWTCVSSIAEAASAGGLTCTGCVSVSEISATGTPSSSTYLRGDGQWEPVAGGGLTQPQVLMRTTNPFGGF